MNRREWMLRAGTAAAATLVTPPAWSLAEGAATRRRDGDLIRLHSNENPLGPSKSARAAMLDAFDEGCLYPSARYPELVDLIAEREGVPSDHVFLGAGSHEVLRVAGMVHGLGGGEVVVPDPTFESMADYAETAGGRVVRVPLTAAFATDLDAMRDAVGDGTRLVFVCNPNNPTGLVVPSADLRGFVADLSGRTTILVDEAYHEYVDTPAYASSVDLVLAGADVIVSRTFSKIHGLAGLRVGYAIASPARVRAMMDFRTRHSIGVVSLMAARASYQDEAFMARSRQENAAGREVVYAAATAAGLECLPSQSNFVFIRTGEPVERFGARMLERGIRVGRPFPPYLDWCRVSVGTHDQMVAFADALTAVASDLGDG